MNWLKALALGEFVHPQNISPNAKTLSYNDAAAYLKANARHAYCIALGGSFMYNRTDQSDHFRLHTLRRIIGRFF